MTIGGGSGTTVSVALAGGGSLIKTGSGTITVSSSQNRSSFSGTIQINAGNMAFSSTGRRAGRPGHHDQQRRPLNISGSLPTATSWLTSGSIVPASAGALALTASSSENINFTGFSNLSLGAVGTQTYSGALTPAGTTYRLGGGGGTLVVAASSPLTNAGTTPQSLVVNGNVTLLGSNTFTGGTTIPTGSLLIVGGGTAGSLVGNVANNGALAFNRSDNPIFSGVISGSGSLTQLGPGGLALAGNNNYTGGTTISAGTLLIGSGGTTGSLAGNVTDNGTLVFNRSDNPIFSGLISGSGNLTQLGPGTLTLTASSTYGGCTTISGGTLLLAGTSGSNLLPITTPLSIVSSATLDLNGISQQVALFSTGPQAALDMTIGSTLTTTTANLAGTLNVTGTQTGPIDLMNYLSSSGSFSTVNIPSGSLLKYTPSESSCWSSRASGPAPSAEAGASVATGPARFPTASAWGRGSALRPPRTPTWPSPWTNR